MKKLILIAALFMLASCDKDDPVPPSPTPCPQQEVSLFGPRSIRVVENAKISYGGQLLDSIQAQAGDTIMIFIPECGAPGKLDVGYNGNTYNVSCVSSQFLPWMVAWQVP